MYVERRTHLLVTLYRIPSIRVIHGCNALYARIVLLRTKGCFLTVALCLASIVSYPARASERLLALRRHGILRAIPDMEIRKRNSCRKTQSYMLFPKVI